MKVIEDLISGEIVHSQRTIVVSIYFLPFRLADRLGEFSETLDKFTSLSSFREFSALTYGDKSPSSHSIVSSIEFDKDGEFFAIAGITMKIKVCGQTS